MVLIDCSGGGQWVDYNLPDGWSGMVSAFLSGAPICEATQKA